MTTRAAGTKDGQNAMRSQIEVPSLPDALSSHPQQPSRATVLLRVLPMLGAAVGRLGRAVLPCRLVPIHCIKYVKSRAFPPGSPLSPPYTTLHHPSPPPLLPHHSNSNSHSPLPSHPSSCNRHHLGLCPLTQPRPKGLNYPWRHRPRRSLAGCCPRP